VSATSLPGRARVSVAIVLYNSRATIGRCLSSLYRRCGEPLEVVVVDNASPQGGLAGLAREFPQARFIFNRRNLGFARAVNQAAAQAGGKFIFLLNPDGELVNDAPGLLADFLEGRPGAAVAGPRLVNPDGSLQTSAYRFPTLAQTAAHLFRVKEALPPVRLRRIAPAWLGGLVGQLNLHDRAQEVDYCTGAALMIRRPVFERLGGLDERFFLYYEEKDFCLRVRQAGLSVWLAPEAVVRHEIGVSSESVPELATLARYRSMLAYFAKHQPGRLAALRVLLRAGAALRHGLSGLAGRGEEARTWRRVFALAREGGR